MDGNCSETSANVQNTGNFNEAVCIDGLRVYDSCSELQSTALIQIFCVPAFPIFRVPTAFIKQHDHTRTLF